MEINLSSLHGKQGLKREVQRQQTGFKKGSATPTNGV